MVKDIMNNKRNNGVMMAAAAEEEVGYVGPKGGTQQGLKKGPWTAAEDAILMEYVKKHGEGNWNSVQKNSGLMRCGKSCRLRWANHLRPNLKKGSFTPEEERLIIHLHSKIGNKWARMASQLPGRTDNEIKNFWNTRMKRRQRAGLPLYPNEFQESTTAFHLHHHHHRRRHQKIENPNFNPNSQSPSLSTLLSSSSHHQKIANPNYNPSLSSVFDPKNFSPSIDTFHNHLTSSFYPNQTQFKFYGDVNSNDGSLAMALHPRPPSSTSIFNQNLAEQAVPTSPSQPPQSLYDYNGPEFDDNVSFTSLIMGDHVGPVGMVLSLNTELPSGKTPPRPTTPPSIASNTTGGGGACDVDSSNQNTSNEHETVQSVMEGDGNSGLLDALLHQSDYMAQKERSNYENLPVSTEYDHKGKGVVNDELIEEEKEEEEDTKNVELSLRNGCEASGENQCDEMSFSQSSIGYGGTNPSEEHVEEMNSMDEDLLSLLNFPSSTPLPLPDWYQQTRNSSKGSLLMGHDNGGLNVQQDASMAEPTTTTNATSNLECALGSYYWNNMPGICEEHPRQDLHVLQRD